MEYVELGPCSLPVTSDLVPPQPSATTDRLMAITIIGRANRCIFIASAEQRKCYSTTNIKTFSRVHVSSCWWNGTWGKYTKATPNCGIPYRLADCAGRGFDLYISSVE